MSEFLPYGKQWVGEDDIAAVTKALQSDYLTTGPTVDAFEASLAQHSGASYATAVNSGTSALHVMYFAAGLERATKLSPPP